MDTLNFELPPHLEASEPPEARGLARDEVRLMVSYLATDRVVHTQFHALPDYLQAGDVLVINTSGTMNAALNAKRADGTALELHLSTHLPGGLWVVEVREPACGSTKPFLTAQAGAPAARAISLFPTVSPLLMPARIALGAAAWWEPVGAVDITLGTQVKEDLAQFEVIA